MLERVAFNWQSLRVQLGEYNFLYVNKWLMCNFGITRFEVRSWKPIPLHLIILPSSATRHALKAGTPGVYTSHREKEKRKHVTVKLDDSIVFVILQRLNNSLHISILFTKTN